MLGIFMSLVTNVVCAFGLTGSERDHELLAAINATCNAGRLVHVEDDTLPDGWFCNGKTLEVNLAVGAFNYLNLREWVDAMRRDILFAEFDCRFVQLIVQDQESDGFGIIEVWRDADSEPAFRWSDV